MLTLLAQRIKVPYPALLALAGAGIALIPGVPPVTLDPELALALFVAPVLLDAAYDASLRDLRDNWYPVGSLVLLAVGGTVGTVAVTARWLVPDMPWAVAVALGAIAAPPDAAAATAVLKSLSPPHRLMVILEGESLLNDASALVIYRLAVGAAITGSFSAWEAAPTLLLACAGGLGLGWILARFSKRFIPTIKEIGVSVLVQFLSTFGVWIIADRLGASAVITTVVYAITLARNPSIPLDARKRRESYAVWEVAVFVLNALAFVLVGMQLRTVLQRIEGRADAWMMVWFALAILLAAMLTRIGFVMISNTLVRWKIRRFGVRLPRPMMLPTVESGLVISWCGMRGIVSLATALALPDGSRGTPVFPYRDLVLVGSFAVVLGTLVVQGLTLRPLLLWLRIGSDGAVEREVALARAATARAALAALELHGHSEIGAALSREYRNRLAGLEAQRQAAMEPGFGHFLAIAVAAERRALKELHLSDEIGEQAYQQVEEELDWAEINARLQS